MMNNIVEKEIDGVLYRAQFKGIAFARELAEQAEKNASNLLIGEILFREILISPEIGIDDFADIETYLKVFDFLFDVARGATRKMPSKSKLTKKVKGEWALWRLVLSQRGFDYPTVFGKSYMTPQDIEEANIALDIQLSEERKAARKKH